MLSNLFGEFAGIFGAASVGPVSFDHILEMDENLLLQGRIGGFGKNLHQQENELMRLFALEQIRVGLFDFLLA